MAHHTITFTVDVDKTSIAETIAVFRATLQEGVEVSHAYAGTTAEMRDDLRTLYGTLEMCAEFAFARDL